MTSTTATAPTYRWDEPRPFLGKCARCAAPVARTWTLDEAGAASYQDRCTCGRWTILRQVDGRFGKRECGSWCEDGVGRSCTCTCGGRAHGQTWRVRP